jgi:hypothetical protein
MADGRVEVMRKLRGATSASVRRLVRHTTARLIDATPVDTGHARANWVPSVGSPYTGIDGSKESVSTAAQTAGLARLASYRLEQGQVFLSNNVPYLAILDQGSSAQAPAGFVDRAIEQSIAEERAIADIERALR